MSCLEDLTSTTRKMENYTPTTRFTLSKSWSPVSPGPSCNAPEISLSSDPTMRPAALLETVFLSSEATTLATYDSTMFTCLKSQISNGPNLPIKNLAMSPKMRSPRSAPLSLVPTTPLTSTTERSTFLEDTVELDTIELHSTTSIPSTLKRGNGISLTT